MYLSKFHFDSVFLFFIWQRYYSFGLCINKKNIKFIIEEPSTEEEHKDFFRRFCSYRYLEEAIPNSNGDKFLPDFFVPRDTNRNIQRIIMDRKINSDLPMVILSPCCSRPGPRQWPKEKFIKVGINLSKYFSVQVVIIGS